MHHPKRIERQAGKARPSSSLWGSKECKFNEAPEVKLPYTSFACFFSDGGFCREGDDGEGLAVLGKLQVYSKEKNLVFQLCQWCKQSPRCREGWCFINHTAEPSKPQGVSVSAAYGRSGNTTILLSSVSNSGTGRRTRVSPCQPLLPSKHKRVLCTKSCDAHTGKKTRRDADTLAHNKLPVSSPHAQVHQLDTFSF